MKQLLMACIFVLLTTIQALAGININKASQSELESLSGIGPSKARAIIAYRTDNGNFNSPSELLMVKGIGPKIFQKIENDIEVE